MKNLITNLFKTLFFFDLVIIALALIPDKKSGHDAVVTLWNEGVACALLLGLTVFFHKIVEKQKFPIKKGFRNLIFLPLGILAGAVLPVLYALAMRLFKSYDFDGFNKISKLWIWILAIFLNALWNELLLRGYLFRLYKRHYGFIFASLFTTALFISMNHEILKGNTKYLASIILLNLLLCFLLEFSNSVIFTVFARFSYCFISGSAFGSKVFLTEYPRISDFTFNGKESITGGEYIAEGSNITIIILAVTLFVMFIIRYKVWQYFSKQKFKEYKEFFGDLGRSISLYFARMGRFMGLSARKR